MSDAIVLIDKMVEDHRPGGKRRDGDLHLTADGITHIAAPPEGKYVVLGVVGLLLITLLVTLLFITLQFPLAGIPIGFIAGVVWAVHQMRRANAAREKWRSEINKHPLEEQIVLCPGSWHVPHQQIQHIEKQMGSDHWIIHLAQEQRIVIQHLNPEEWEKVTNYIGSQGWSAPI